MTTIIIKSATTATRTYMMISNELSSDVDAPVSGSVTVVVVAAVVAAIGMFF